MKVINVNMYPKLSTLRHLCSHCIFLLCICSAAWFLGFSTDFEVLLKIQISPRTLTETPQFGVFDVVFRNY